MNEYALLTCKKKKKKPTSLPSLYLSHVSVNYKAVEVNNILFLCLCDSNIS